MGPMMFESDLRIVRLIDREYRRQIERMDWPTWERTGWLTLPNDQPIRDLAKQRVWRLIEAVRCKPDWERMAALCPAVTVNSILDEATRRAMRAQDQASAEAISRALANRPPV